MASIAQLTGMRGVYLVAAELSRLGLIASPTSRSAIGADILVTDQRCTKAWSVQVKTNAKTFSFWLLGPKTKEMVSAAHVYVLVNIRSARKGRVVSDDVVEYFVVPSKVIAKRMKHSWSKNKSSEWFAIYRDKITEFQDQWDAFEA